MLTEQVAYSDVGPVMLLSEASVDDLNSRLEKDVTVERFRPNIIIGDCQPFEEVFMAQISSHCSHKRENTPHSYRLELLTWGGLFFFSCVGKRIIWSFASDSRCDLFSVSCVH